MSARAPSVFAKAHASIDVLYREMVKFGAVGAIAFVVDIGVFNLMRTGIIGGAHGLAEKPLTAKTISVLAATIVAWVGNRYWTFRRRRRASRRREFVLFGVMNIGGLGIALACLAFSHYVLGQTSALADNIAGNVVGLGLGTLFRFWAYRQFVFTATDTEPAVGDASFEAPVDRPARLLSVDRTDRFPADRLLTDDLASDEAVVLDLRDQAWSVLDTPSLTGTDDALHVPHRSPQRREAWD